MADVGTNGRDRLVAGVLYAVLLALSTWTLSEVVDLGQHLAATRATVQSIDDRVGRLEDDRDRRPLRETRVGG